MNFEEKVLREIERNDFARAPDRGAKLASLLSRYQQGRRLQEQAIAEFGGLMSRHPASRSMLEHAIESLTQRSPRHYEEITKEMLANGYRTTGATPERSVNAVLRRHPEVFVAFGRGVYGL